MWIISEVMNYISLPVAPAPVKMLTAAAAWLWRSRRVSCRGLDNKDMAPTMDLCLMPDLKCFMISFIQILWNLSAKQLCTSLHLHYSHQSLRCCGIFPSGPGGREAALLPHNINYQVQRLSHIYVSVNT